MQTCQQCGVELSDTGAADALCGRCRTATGAPSAAPGATVTATVPGTEDASASGPDAIERLWGLTLSGEPAAELTLGRHGDVAAVSRRLTIRQHVFDPVAAGDELQTDYELQQVLGTGGMGVVHTARQNCLDRTVAVKMLKPDRVADPRERARFLAEAMVMGDLDHPNIPPVYHLGENEAGEPFYAMKQVKGRPWSAVIREKTLAENLDILQGATNVLGPYTNLPGPVLTGPYTNSITGNQQYFRLAQ